MLMNSTEGETTTADGRESRRFWPVALLLFAVTVAVFWGVTRCDFINYDDDHYVTGNAWVRQGLSWKGAAWAIGWRDTVYWHPIGWLSHMVDVACFGMKPWGHHLTNLLLHAANGVLLFALLRQITGAFWRSAMVAALFALHPLHVESVAWITERKDVLSGFFGLLCLIFYAKHAQQSRRGDRPSSVASYLVALVFFALGLMSKAMLMTWPILMLLLDYWPLNRFGGPGQRPPIKRLILEKIPFLLLSAAATAITVAQHLEGGTVVQWQAVPWTIRICSAAVAYAVHLAKFLCPVNLAIPYLYAEPFPAWQVSLAVGLVVNLTIAAMVLLRSRPWFMVGWLWFVIALAPVIGIVRIGHDFIADRFTYLPSIGLLVVLVWFCAELAAKLRVSKWGLGFVAMLALAFYAGLTFRQVGYWRSTETLFRHTLQVRPGNKLALSNLSAFLLKTRGATPEALAMIRQSLLRNKNNPVEWNNYGAALVMQNRYAEAAAAYESALRIAPDQFEAHANLGRVLVRMGQAQRALAELQEALRHAPDDSGQLEAVRKLISQLHEATKPAESSR